MRVDFHCPNCGQSYRLTPRIARQNVQCHRCRTIFQAPATTEGGVALRGPAPAQAAWSGPEPPSPKGADPWVVALDATLDSPAVTVGPYARPMSEADRVLLGVGVTLAVLALICASLHLVFTGSVTSGVALLVMLVGLGGVCLAAFALRRRAVMASMLAGGLGLLILLSTVVSVQQARPSVKAALSPPSGAASPTRRSAPPDAALPPRVASELVTGPAVAARCRRSEPIGNAADGELFEKACFTAPVTHVLYSLLTAGGQTNLRSIEPGLTGDRMALVAKSGYALGGITVAGTENSFHAIQVIFMRLRPDDTLDPQDSYSTEWVGTPQGAIRTVRSSGARVVGFYGSTSMVVHAIGLLYAANPPALAADSPAAVVPVRADAEEPKTAEESPFVRKTLAVETTAAKPATEKNATALAAGVPRSVAEALGSTVLIEHPLAAGSGFVVDKNIVATNAHVVEGAYPEEITVKFGNENDAPRRVSRVLYIDPQRDLCLLEGEGIEAPRLKVRSDYVLQTGDAVVLLGNPSVKGGILMRNVTNSGRLRSLMHIDGQEMYHIDADVNPGWSGGPVLDSDGQVIAVVVMKAGDSVVNEIRQTMEKLDESFRTAHGSDAQVGITYGIPGSALATVLANNSLRDAQRQTVANDHYVARTLLGRLRFLAALAMLRVQVNVPLPVRREADAYAQGSPIGPQNRFSTIKVDYVELMPESTAASLRMMVARSPQVREMEAHFVSGLDTRLNTVANSPHLSSDVKRDLKALTAKIRDIAVYAENPSVTYAAYSVKVSAFTRDLKQLLARLEKRVDDKGHL